MFNSNLFRIVIRFLYAVKDINLSENELSNDLEKVYPFYVNFYRV